MVSTLAIIVLAIAVVYLVTKKPVFNLAKLEKTYNKAVAKHGESAGSVIVTSVQIAAEVMEAKFTAGQEAKEQQAKALDEANEKEEQAVEIVEAAERALENAKSTAKDLEAEAGSKRKRANKLQKLQDLL